MIGHDRIRAELERQLPPVTLLTGLPGVGKWTLAEHLAGVYGTEWDTLLLRGKWGVKDARQAGKFAQGTPQESWRVIAADLGSTTQAAAQNALLKVLEEPPAHAKFILAAEPGIALPTIGSRAVTYYLAPLGRAQTLQVLEGLGLSAPEAAAAAVLAPGRPGAAWSVAKDALAARDNVREVLSAARDGSPRRLDRCFRKWGPLESMMLGCWAQEASIGTWRAFTAQDAPKGGKTTGRTVLRHRTLSNSRPQIADRRIIDLIMQQQLI